MLAMPSREKITQLLALNQAVPAKIEMGEPVAAPGVPKNYPGAQKLVTEDCIKPAQSPEDGSAEGRVGQVRRFPS